MGAVAFWAVLFSIATTVSILLLGHRDLIGGEMSVSRIARILFDWRFLLGAAFAFLARILFILTNNAVYRIPELAQSSTTITTLINSAAIILVIAANAYFLDERLNATQSAGAVVVLAGLVLLTLR